MEGENQLLESLKESNPRKTFRKNLNNLVVFIAEIYQKYVKKEELERLKHVKTLRPTSYKRLMEQGFYKTVNCASLSAYKNMKKLNKFKTKHFTSTVYGVNNTFPSSLGDKKDSQLEEIVE